ncbi:TniB family NTP-binding protein [Mesorhizobium sp. NBSH29]|uniref:TniB family NTP-binding protein n=1 Tax=Mesorhizobium sp. NBSH29 TaxID=2654249 RepID=UPI0021561A0F|nr:TniB family NTP-binding protein [Mesorhizobium sp. NBSH29]
MIDEVHSLQAGTVREQTRFLNLLRFLGNELRIPLVCVGTQQARNALRTDDQLVRRFEAVALPPWQNDEDFGGLIGSLQRTLPLRRPSEDRRSHAEAPCRSHGRHLRACVFADGHARHRGDRER